MLPEGKILLIWENSPPGIARVVIWTVWPLKTFWCCGSRITNLVCSTLSFMFILHRYNTGEDAAPWRNAKAEIPHENYITNKRKYSLRNPVLWLNLPCLAGENSWTWFTCRVCSSAGNCWLGNRQIHCILQVLFSSLKQKAFFPSGIYHRKHSSETVFKSEVIYVWSLTLKNFKRNTTFLLLGHGGRGLLWCFGLGGGGWVLSFFNLKE